MSFHIRVFQGIALSCCTLLGGYAMATPWSDMAKQDLQALHDILSENHPGAVDEENTRFRRWLADGLEAGMRDAEAAASLSDYRTTLLKYTNGFRDNHIFLVPRADMLYRRWPGFTVHQDSEGRFLATLSEVQEVPDGAQITRCDDVMLSVRLDRDLAPVSWNPDVPHRKGRLAPELFFLGMDVEPPASCEVVVDGVVQPVDLAWRPLPREEALEKISLARGANTPPFGVRSVSGVWFVSMPHMGDVPEDFFTDLEASRDRLREASHVVLDMRGNGGGNSQHGARVLSILYGEDAVGAIVGSFDWTVDWRASPGNLAELRKQTFRGEQFFDDMAASIEAGRPFHRTSQPPTATAEPGAASPFSGKVFALTDGACASACLDFMDVALRLPGVTHIGLPTSADAVYIDNRSERLPSGLSVISFGMKVYRNRVRANNEYYTPSLRWPGGLMTDEAVAAWVKELN
ncbi:S41 family peptidase [Alkalisalibacterium limincola]|uniref:Tail specific protease domain-containing protein n=1 Tax=Alkalisalibacterium limincola TaxID=2699169 RepID=A0A5C8KJR2_9GAMM|nr:S41 family peptidase [Alkalisalibacterium limincola]TXK59624.1 hypothetical protein FU658_13335 [Alkalisalibacterium limincola]